LISAATILAEMGDYRDFQNADKLAMYFGIVPAVYSQRTQVYSDVEE
jgi:transposase